MPQESVKNHNLKAVPKIVEHHTDNIDGEIAECPLCFGTGMEVVPGKGARICACRHIKKQSGQFESVRLPKRYDGVSFDTYKPIDRSQAFAEKWAENFASEYPAVEHGLLLMGSVGVGKTHLAVSILRKLTERGIACLFYEFSSLLKEIQDSYNPNTHSSELECPGPCSQH